MYVPLATAIAVPHDFITNPP
ncbi:unnamed protein product [Ectocarpus sp. CCAP 1310/34]|nr:unnamed protein product [Ectocarpus sp. CCAP 1310/34]